MRFELMTSSLPRRRSTPELRGRSQRMRDEGGGMNHSAIHPSSFLLHPFKSGAGDEIRTRDPQLGRLMLYQLSYTRSRKDEGGRRKDEIWQPTPSELFILHPSYFIPTLVQGAGFEPA